MSDHSPEKNQELAQVLSRISALMRHGEPATEAPVLDESIPLLTEVYEGEPITFASHHPQEFPALNQVSSPLSATDNPIPAEVVEMLLIEMMPLIQTAVRKAVQQELANAEQLLSTKLEAELIQSLRERLQSSLF